MIWTGEWILFIDMCISQAYWWHQYLCLMNWWKIFDCNIWWYCMAPPPTHLLTTLSLYISPEALYMIYTANLCLNRKWFMSLLHSSAGENKCWENNKSPQIVWCQYLVQFWKPTSLGFIPRASIMLQGLHFDCDKFDLWQTVNSVSYLSDTVLSVTSPAAPFHLSFTLPIPHAFYSSSLQSWSLKGRSQHMPPKISPDSPFCSVMFKIIKYN